MCMSDIAFFGHYADIVKLQSFDSFHEVAGTNLGASLGKKPLVSFDSEIRRYTPAFHSAYPVLQEYYRISNRFFLGIHELRRAMLAKLYDEDYYWQYMGAYFDILKKILLDRPGHRRQSSPLDSSGKFRSDGRPELRRSLSMRLRPAGSGRRSGRGLDQGVIRRCPCLL